MIRQELTPEQIQERKRNDRKAASFHAHAQGLDNPDKSGRPRPCGKPFLIGNQEMASAIDSKTGKPKKPCSTCTAATAFFASLSLPELSRVLR